MRSNNTCIQIYAANLAASAIKGCNYEQTEVYEVGY